ncbi:amidohydrolase family protein [Microbacterium sp. NPDC058342]|uniref:N-acyl-D-amino-acid deacylase family protein n=1 Tax=Microbacterium sp. NPDC058342 TaxID=3346454 RepID=UPI00364ED2C4
MTRSVLAGGLVIDGTGAEGYVADVTIDGGEIVSIDPASDSHGSVPVRDLGGRVVAPGFIDTHSHADNAPLRAEADVSKILQGVTTEIVGNCGLSLAPRSRKRGEALSSYLERFFPVQEWQGESFVDFLALTDRAGYITNYAPLVGHNTLRIAAMGFEAREPTAAEAAEMRRMLESALDAGAVGFTSGLVYPPGRFAGTVELVDLAHSLVGRPALYASHVRSESGDRIAAAEEAITVGRDAGVRVQISHHKAMGKAHWGEVALTLALARDARASGVDVRFDVYPYTASSTSLASCLPARLAGLPNDELLAALERPEIVATLRRELAMDDWDNHVAQAGGYSGILIASTYDGRFEGQTLEEAARELGVDGADALVHVLLSERLRASMICFAMSEADVEAAMRDEFTSIGSDGLPPGLPGKPHPRQWGTFPRVLSRYVRERGVLGLEQAVHRMTGLPAETFRLPGVGRIAEGYAADLVVFDPAGIEDRATYADPERGPRGVDAVYVNGVEVVSTQGFTGRRAGRRLRSA